MAWELTTAVNLLYAGADILIMYHPEAAVAGALGIQLGGVSNYFGKAVNKPFIGDPGRTVEARDILQTNRLMLLGSFLFLLLMLLLRTLFLYLLA